MLSFNRRSYSGTAPDATLSADMNDTTLTVTCDDLTGWPDGTGGPFEVTLEPGTSSEEKCWGDTRSGNTITLLARGMEGSAVAHTATTTTVRHGFSALDADEANYAVSQTVGQISAKGDLLQGTSANTLEKIAVGSAGQALVVAAGKWVAGLPTLGLSNITGLVTALAGKLATPTTAIAKGSLLAGTGANVADSLAVGTDGTVLTADSSADAGVSWQASSAVALLAAAVSSASVTLPASTAALDTTNLKLTFTAPSSGRVLLRASASLNNGGTSGSWTFGWYTHGTTTVVGSAQAILSYSGISNASLSGRYTGEQLVTGLTAGTSYTLDLTGLRGQLSVTASDFVLTAWAA